MQYRKLKHANILLSEIGLGTWALGGPYWTDNQSTGWTGALDEDDIILGMREAFDNGINHVDTADVYGYGKSERLIGRAIRGIPRGDLILASKVGWVKTSSESPFTPLNIRQQCEHSLRNLNTDYLDIYYFHHCDFGPGDRYLHEAVSTMNDLRKEGKIRCVGLSGYSEGELLRAAKVIEPAIIQSWADIEHDEFIREGTPLRLFMDANGIAFVPMMPFGQGRLLGKYDHDSPPKFDDGDNRRGNPSFTRESLAELQPRIAALKERFGDSTQALARVAIQYLLANPIVVSVIPGFRNAQQLRSNIAASAPPLTEADLAFILDVFPRNDMGPHPWAN